MLFGNPHAFAIWFDRVAIWSDDAFSNGCFGYFIKGKLFFSDNSTLGTDLFYMSKLYCMNNSVADDKLFAMPAAKMYYNLYLKAFPSPDSGIDNDYTYFVSPESLADDGFYVFLVESGDMAKLVYGKGKNPSAVFELTLERGEFQRIVKEAIDAWDAWKIAKSA